MVQHGGCGDPDLLGDVGDGRAPGTSEREKLESGLDDRLAALDTPTLDLPFYPCHACVTRLPDPKRSILLND
jgi:hypothetical protein